MERINVADLRLGDKVGMVGYYDNNLHPILEVTRVTKAQVTLSERNEAVAENQRRSSYLDRIHQIIYWFDLPTKTLRRVAEVLEADGFGDG